MATDMGTPAPGAVGTSSKFVALMAGEDRLAEVVARPVTWQSLPPNWYGSAELTTDIFDPAAPQSAPRQMHLVKGLLHEEEIDRLRVGFDAMSSHAESGDTHACVLVEDGHIVCEQLHALLLPALDERIMPYARERTGESRVVVADALIRAYREEDKRQALAPHFDASSFATIIIPLNPGQYEGGLFVQEGADASSRLDVDGSFDKGDALIHSFDVMHGVEVTAGSRFSLVLWLSDCRASLEACAAPWVRQAADNGNAYAEFLFSDFSKSGRYGVAQDLDLAVEYVSRAARQGHALAQHRLGTMHRIGNGVEQSHERCLELWRSAAEAGLASAQADLAWSYANGALGVKDAAEARQWYERAARQGHEEAMIVIKYGYA